MRANRLATARFFEVTPVRDGRTGVMLSFRPERSRLGVARIDDFADLGPGLTIPAVGGIGKVIRVLRAGKIAAPPDPFDLVGDEEAAATLLERATGTLMRLELKPRFRLRFVAWTESGVETVDDILEVREYQDAYHVVRKGARVPARFERDAVVRHSTEQDSWWEIVDIERA